MSKHGKAFQVDQSFFKKNGRQNQCISYLISRKADMVIIDEPSTRKASHPFAASMAASALALGTLSPKKTTCNYTRSMTIPIYYYRYSHKFSGKLINQITIYKIARQRWIGVFLPFLNALLEVNYSID